MSKMARGYKLGWKKQLPDFRDFKYATPSRILKALPPSIDLRGYFPPVYDQGSLGSCTSQAIAAMDYFCQIKQKESGAFQPSRLFIYWNEREMEGTINEDSGAYIRDGMKSVAQQGVCAETMWTYDVNKFKDKPPTQCYEIALKHQTISYKAVTQNLDELKGCLAEGFPFVFGFSVYESFESDVVAKTGIMPMPNQDESLKGGHAVCVPIGTFITTSEGPKKIEEVKQGDLVLTHLGRFRKVIKISNRLVDESLVVIPNHCGNDLKMTKEHPVYSKTYSYQTKLTQTSEWGQMTEDVQWIEAGNLRKGCLLYRPIALEEKTGDSFPYEEDFFELLGMYVGDGNIAKRLCKNGNIKSMKLRFSLGKNYPELIERCKYLLSRYSKNKISEYWYDNYVIITCYDTHLAKLVGSICGHARKKTISSDVLFAPVSLQKKLITGWVNTDGCVFGNDISIHMVVENLMWELCLILQRCGLLYSIYKRPSKDSIIKGKKTHSKKAYSVLLCNCNESFIQNRTKHKSIYEKNYLISKITRTGLENYKGNVFNLYVEEDNSYVANGIAVHNCSVGYDDSKRAFLIRNSWSASWGQEGNFWMPYDFIVNPNMASDFWTIRAVEDEDGNIPQPPVPTPNPQPDAPCNWSTLFSATRAFVNSAVGHADMVKMVSDQSVSTDRMIEAGLRGLQEHLNRVESLRNRKK